MLSPRLERVPGVAAVTVDGGLRRQIHVELSKEKITALDLSVDRVVNVLRTENQNIPLGEIYQRRPDVSAAQPGAVPEPRPDPRSRRADPDRRAGLHARHRRGQGLDRRHPFRPADQRQARRPHAGHEAVGHEHGRRSPQAVRAEIERINREVPGVKLTVLDDSAKFIERSIGAVQEHVMIGSVLVIADHLPVPAELPLDAHRLHVDSDLGRSARSRCSISPASR